MRGKRRSFGAAFKAKKEELVVRGRRGCLPVISSLGNPGLMQVNLVSLEAPRCCVERVVILHAAAPGQNLRCVSIQGTEVRVRNAVICMEASTEAFWVSEAATCQVDHSIIAAGFLILGRLTASNSLILNRDHPEFHNVASAATVFNYGVSVDLHSCTILGSVGDYASRGVLCDSVALAVWGTGETRVEFSDIFGNYSGWTSGFCGAVAPGKGTFSADPRFCDPANLDFRLMPDSPRIGKASDGGDIGCRYTPEMMELCRTALELRAKGIIKF